MRKWMILACLLVGPHVIGAARAEVVSASEGAFVVRSEAVSPVETKRAWRALGEIGKWWNPEHTYSGDAGRMSLDRRAGGCFCESWSGQSVEHGRVVLNMEHEGVRTIRIAGALGPLQELGANGVLTFRISGDGAGSRIAADYRVSGDPSLALNALAPVVDAVLEEQVSRLARYAATGNPAPQ